MPSSPVCQASASMTAFLVSETCAHLVCPHTHNPLHVAEQMPGSLLKVTQQVAEKQDSSQGLWLQSLVCCSQPQFASVLGVQLPYSLLWKPAVLQAVGVASVKDGCSGSRAWAMEAGCPPCPVEPALGQGSDWASAISAQGTPRYMSCCAC